MTKKLIIASALVVAVVLVGVFGGVNWVKSQVGAGKIFVETWTGNFVEDGGEVVVSGDEVLGGPEFADGIPFGQLDSGVLKENVVFLSSDEVRAIERSPKLLVADPGSGNVTQIVSIIGRRDFSSESFRFTGDSAGIIENEGFEVKWGNCCTTASGMNGALVLGGSFSRGFTNGNGTNRLASPSIEIWTPSGGYEDSDFRGASTSLQTFPLYASQSAVYLTSSSSFPASNDDNETNFWFRVIYRILRLPDNI